MDTSHQNFIQDKDQFSLITGIYTPSDALEIMRNLINGKINFHNLKNFSSQVRFGKADEYSLKRMEELSNDLNAITQLVNQCKEQGKSLKIDSTISIQVI